MKPGDRVTIHGSRSSAEGIVASILPPAQLPDIPGARGAEVRAILAEANFHQVALIEYDFLGTTLGFFALQDPEGTWFDLQGQPLIIEQHAAENADRSHRRRRA